MSEIKTRADYLGQLRAALRESDPALVQDAVYDVNEFLREEQSRVENGGSEAELIARLLDSFGTPLEVADSYRRTEAQVLEVLRPTPPPPPENLFEQIFGVLLDPAAYGALFFMLLSLWTGIVYFTWAVAGTAMTLGLAVLIIGVPFFVLFAGSLRVLSLTEGRLVETLTGVRMPRRPTAAEIEGSIWARALHWVKDGRTWSSLLYMILKLPLGILSFTFAITLLSFALAFLVSPFVGWFGLPVVSFPSFELYLPWWTFPLMWLLAILTLVVLLQLARGFARLQGGMAKRMLVG